MGVIETLAGANWSPGIVRNAYLRIDATGGSTITSVGFQNLATTGQADFLVFDRLAILQTSSVPEPGSGWLFIFGAALAGLRLFRQSR